MSGATAAAGLKKINQTDEQRKAQLAKEFTLNHGQWRQMTHSGDNSRPVLSKDGTRISFLSSARPAHQNSQVYLFDFKENHEERITYSDGSTQESLPWNEGVYYISDTETIKEKPAPLMENPVHENDVFLSTELSEPGERITSGDKIHQNLSAGRNAVLWTTGGDEKKVVTHSEASGMGSISFLPTGHSVQAHVDIKKGYWAWIVQKKSDSPYQTFIKLGDNAKAEEISIGATKDTRLHWWSTDSGTYLWIENPSASANEVVKIFDPTHKCLISVLVENQMPVSGKLESLIPPMGKSGFIAVIGNSPNRHIYQSLENFGDSLKKALLTQKLCDQKVNLQN